MISFLEKVLANYKSLTVGTGVAGLQLYANGIDWKHVLLAVGMVIFSALVKDLNVTGGDKPNAGATSVVVKQAEKSN